MATPDQVLPNLVARIKELERRLDYVDQRSQMARPVRFDYTQDGVTNVSLPTAITMFKEISMATPVGFSTCHVVTWTTAKAVNSRGVGDYVSVMANINGWDAGALYQFVPAGAGGSAATAPHLTISGLTAGQVIPVQVKAWAGGGAWAANAANEFAVGATFIWFR